MRTVSKTAMVVLAVGGLVSAAAGMGMADTKGGGARATGGDGVGEVTQQNVAQEGKQNSNCSNAINMLLSAGESGDAAKCFSRDQSKLLFSKVRNGKAEAVGGSGSLMLQQNVAQEGRQNHSCTQPISTSVRVAETRCAALDESLSYQAFTSGRGAKAVGGDNAGILQQYDIAQEGRQNNSCDDHNSSNLTADAKVDCVALDKSLSDKTFVSGGGAKAKSGGGVLEYNLAQEGRQNNSCANANGEGVEGLQGADVESEVNCVALDKSFSKKTFTSGRGAKAEGGAGASTNVAQEGRQNNSCGTSNLVQFRGTTKRKCTVVDKSVSVNTTTRGGGAKSAGGDSATESVSQQNVAQEGRQNNSCGNPKSTTINAPSTTTCGAVDESVEIDQPQKKPHGKKGHRKSHR